jgi:hypothetical protein
MASAKGRTVINDGRFQYYASNQRVKTKTLQRYYAVGYGQTTSSRRLDAPERNAKRDKGT